MRHLILLAGTLALGAGCGRSQPIETVHNKIVAIESEWINAHNSGIETHNHFVQVESDFVDAYNDATRAHQQIDATQRAIDRLQAGSSETTSDEYGAEMQQYVVTLKNLITALNDAGDATVQGYLATLPKTAKTLTKIQGTRQLQAVRKAQRSLAALDMSKCPEDYRGGVKNWNENLARIEASLQTMLGGGEFDGALMKRHIVLVKRLNEIGRSHGLIIGD